MTRGMIVTKYNSEEVADRIITNKMATEEMRKTQTKPHPDDPENTVFRLHAVHVHIWHSILLPLLR